MGLKIWDEVGGGGASFSKLPYVGEFFDFCYQTWCCSFGVMDHFFEVRTNFVWVFGSKTRTSRGLFFHAVGTIY